jgi:hypothetical protein
MERTGKRALRLVLIALFAVLMLSGCIPGDGKATAGEPAGFFWGIWHGWVAPISLIISIFRDNIAIYEVNNTGFWYDFGYYLAIVGGFGGLSLVRRRSGQGKKE